MQIITPKMITYLDQRKGLPLYVGSKAFTKGPIVDKWNMYAGLYSPRTMVFPSVHLTILTKIAMLCSIVWESLRRSQPHQLYNLEEILGRL